MAWVNKKVETKAEVSQAAPAPVVAPVVQQPVKQVEDVPVFDVGTIATQTELVPTKNGEQIDILRLLVEIANKLERIEKSISG
jgi:hypothetical protein